MTCSRRAFVTSGAAFAAVGSMSAVIASARTAAAHGRSPFKGYGDLVPDPAGVLDLPVGFKYQVFSREGDPMTHGGKVPGSHDGMAAFSAGFLGTWLVRNHELDDDSINEDGLTPVPLVRGATYDPECFGGTTTLLVGRHGRLLGHWASLAGTSANCAGGPSPWGTWLTCEETDEVKSKPHGYVFEVDPWFGGNPRPIKGMGRFEHEAVAFDERGTAYLSEDAGDPFGCLYRFRPDKPLHGKGSLHAGGILTAAAIEGVTGDLSIVQEPGTRLRVKWIDVPNPDPGEDDETVREQVIAAGATPIMKAEGLWTGNDGSIWFVSSRGDGPDAEDEEDRSAAVHAGQIWRYDPRSQKIELVVIFAAGVPYDGPDNITVGPHGFAVVCSDGEDEQSMTLVRDDGSLFPFARNAFSDDEFAGATFSPDGDTLFANIQGQPALTFAITGPWAARRR
jgi:secreted PhoX family phosphatase